MPPPKNEMQDPDSNVTEEESLINNIPIHNPCNVLAAANDPKLFTSAAQKHDTASPTVVTRYTGRFPIFTASVLQMRLLAAMETMHEPFAPGLVRTGIVEVDGDGEGGSTESEALEWHTELRGEGDEGGCEEGSDGCEMSLAL